MEFSKENSALEQKLFMSFLQALQGAIVFK